VNQERFMNADVDQGGTLVIDRSSHTYRSRRARAARGDRGAVLIEFALVFPILAMLMLGTITGGFALNKKQQVTHAAREGARYAATVPSNQTFMSGTWAENVRDLIVERSDGDLSSSQVCVSLVQGSPATVVAVAANHSTTGQPCIAGQTYPVTASDVGLRVQVTATRPVTIELGLGSVQATINAKATAKAEGTL
jgi:Flp pilus assembly protein TadG